MMRSTAIGLWIACTITAAGGCVLRSASIADLERNPARYHDRTVTVTGVVTTSWAIPLVPFALYRVADGTGELTVISRGGRTPTRGARVRVRGRVEDIAVLGGRAIGLHLREGDLHIRR